MKNRDTENLEKHSRKLEARDKVGLVGEGISTLAGTAAGVAGSTTIASVAGATSTVFFGSSTLGGMLGIGAVVTPVGWVIGSAVAGTAIAYGVCQLVRSGGRHDRIREEIKQDIDEELARRSQAVRTTGKIQLLESLLERAVRMGRISSDKKRQLLDAVNNGDMEIRIAKMRALHLVTERSNAIT